MRTDETWILAEPVEISQFTLIVAVDDGVHLGDHVGGSADLLEHVFVCTPHIPCIDSFEISKKGAFFDQVSYGGQVSFNRTVVNQYVGIL